MLTTDGINEISSAVLDLIGHGQFTMDGTNYDVDLYETQLDGENITVKLYIDDSYSGTVTNFKLIGTSGKVLAERPDSVSKPETKGILVIFTFNVKEV